MVDKNIYINLDSLKHNTDISVYTVEELKKVHAENIESFKNSKIIEETKRSEASVIYNFEENIIYNSTIFIEEYIQRYKFIFKKSEKWENI